jgi:hypothetical protein
MSETVGDRIREIRSQHDEKQPAFAARLTAAARKLGVKANYDNTMVSKMETGRRDVTLDDVAVLASIDKLQRGKLWLGWGENGAVATTAATESASRPAAKRPPPLESYFVPPPPAHEIKAPPDDPTVPSIPQRRKDREGRG